MKNFRINHFCYTFSSHVWIKTHSRLDNHCLFAGLETAALTAVVAAVLVQILSLHRVPATLRTEEAGT